MNDRLFYIIFFAYSLKFIKNKFNHNVEVKIRVVQLTKGYAEPSQTSKMERFANS